MRSSSLRSSSLHGGPTLRQAVCQGWGHTTFREDEVPASSRLLVGGASKRYISKRCSGQDVEGVRRGRAREGGRRGFAGPTRGAGGLLRAAAGREPASSGREWSGGEVQAPGPGGGHELGVFEEQRGGPRREAFHFPPRGAPVGRPAPHAGSRSPAPGLGANIAPRGRPPSLHLTRPGALGRQKRHSGCLCTVPR